MTIESLHPVMTLAAWPRPQDEETTRSLGERRERHDPKPSAAAIELIEFTGGSSRLLLGKHIDTYA